MFCTKCGKKLEDDEKICTHCGKMINSESRNAASIGRSTEQDKKNPDNSIWRNILIGIGAVGTVVLLGIAFPSEPNEHSDSSNASVATDIMADNTAPGSEDAFAVDMDHLFDSYYIGEVTHHNGKIFYDEEECWNYEQDLIDDLYIFLEMCGYELEEIHDIDQIQRLSMLDQFDNLPNDGSKRKLIDGCNGDTKKMFGYMALSLCNIKKVNYNGEWYKIDIFSNRRYGMEYWFCEKNKDNPNCYPGYYGAIFYWFLTEPYQRYVDYISALIEEGYTYEEAVDMIENECKNSMKVSEAKYIKNEVWLDYLSIEQVEAFEDIAYTIFVNFYKEQGIDDYYYILDNEEEYAPILVEEVESKEESPYIPMKDRGGYEYQKNLYKSLAP